MLVCICRWAWTTADKDKDGTISQRELMSVITKYKAYLREQPDIMKLISRFDSNGDRILDSTEMQKLLQVTYPKTLILVKGSKI